MVRVVGGLVLYHLMLFRAFYFKNPYAYASSELLEQGYASFLHRGRELRAGRFLPVDPYYYPEAAGIPFLASFYPPQLVGAWLATFLPLNQAWMLYSLMMVGHCLWASLGVWWLLQSFLPPIVALFGALTLSSLGYAIKQNSCIVSTLAWVPVFLLSSWIQSTMLTGISLGMMLLAGYWPVAVPATGLGVLLWLMR